MVSSEILCMVFLLVLAVTSGHFLRKSGHKYLQEAGLTTLIGIITGIILTGLNITDTIGELSEHFENLFMIMLLPPIIFESGYNMQTKPFFKNIGSVLSYSFIGTFIAIILSSLLFFYTGQMGISYKFTM